MTVIKGTIGGKSFCWDCFRDTAEISDAVTEKTIWAGSLLPSFRIFRKEHSYSESHAIKTDELAPGRWKIFLSVNSYGNGSMICEIGRESVLFRELEIEWEEDTLVSAVHFGTKKLTERQRLIANTDEDFWPDWSAHEYCVPCAGGSPTHSFWRKWDMGNASLPLGSYGSSMGTPYSAAFPRPLYACAMGENGNGWVAIGAGEIPDAAMTLKIMAASGYIEYLYREDLWDTPHRKRRRWQEPLRISTGDSAYEAYSGIFDTYRVKSGEKSDHLKSFFGTWGNFMNGDFDLRKISDLSLHHIPADILLIDDSWESSVGSGVADTERFPRFEDDIAYIRKNGQDIGVWMSCGWIKSPGEFGLTEDDLLLGVDGKPRLTAWIQDPYMPDEKLYYALDPSSERTRRFLEERSRAVVRKYNPGVLKLDFGYGLPGPDFGSPRDPSMRGEKLCHTLLKIVGRAAKEINPQLTIIYYGISPLMSDVCDMISIDDMGDCGDSAEYEIAGHSQRCLWGSLVAKCGMPLNSSSGYFWEAIRESLLDSLVLGVNGTVLPETDSDGHTVTGTVECCWLAVQKWRRRNTSQWVPVFLEANFGGRGSEPVIRSWARAEGPGGERGICSASLRSRDGEMISYPLLPGISFSGKWAIVSLDENDIYTCGKLAVIPFSPGVFRIDGDFRKVESDKRNGAADEPAGLLRGNEVKITSPCDMPDDIVGYILYRSR